MAAPGSAGGGGEKEKQLFTVMHRHGQAHKTNAPAVVSEDEQ